MLKSELFLITNSRYKIFFHLNSHRIFFYLFIIVFVAQFFFWYHTNSVKPEFDIVPTPPSPYFVRAASLGDNEFLFRILAIRLQNSGDVFAGFVSLKKYDYSRLYQWFKLLDNLNYQSNLIPFLATYYYSQTQNKADTIYVIKYLDEHATQDLDKKWWWLFQAIYIATNSLRNPDLALKLAYKLAENNSPNAPLWTRQMPAFLYEKQGNSCMAFKVIQNIINENQSGERKITAEEMNFMRHFINERLKKLKNQKFNPKLCK